jgi:hypothetical protein
MKTFLNALRLRACFKIVAQTSSLLYRRFLTCMRDGARGSADWKSAIQQVENLRYKGFAFLKQAVNHQTARAIIREVFFNCSVSAEWAAGIEWIV